MLDVTTGEGGNQEPLQWEAGGKRHSATAHAGCPHLEKGRVGLAEESRNPFPDLSKPSSAPTYTALGIDKKKLVACTGGADRGAIWTVQRSTQKNARHDRHTGV